MASALQNYRLGKTIGMGSFAKVKSAVHVHTGKKVAIKILNRKQMRLIGIEDKVQRETIILRLLTHPHITRQYEVIETADNIYVVMEYVKSGELFDYIIESGRLPEDEARHLFQQIISGVEYCHHNRIAHRDLKPENILLVSKCHIKIADFGLSNVMQDGHFLKTSCGSPNYAAPEVISGEPYSGPEVDIWSCGVILYALLCGNLPFDDEHVPNLFHKIKSGVYTLADHLSTNARDLIPRMLTVDPMMRISIPEIRQHPWFNQNLPHYLNVPPSYATQQARNINEEIVQKVVSMGFDRNQVLDSLFRRAQNQATVAYHLLLDSRKSVVPSHHLQSKFKQISSGTFIPTIPYQVGHPLVDHHKARLSAQLRLGINWSLGLQSQGTPSEIMSEIFKALQNLNVGWKIIGAYNLKCRWIPSFSTNTSTQQSRVIMHGSAQVTPTIIKIELQLYKVRDGKYLLDIQRVSGPQLLFYKLSADFLRELGVL